MVGRFRQFCFLSLLFFLQAGLFAPIFVNAQQNSAPLIKSETTTAVNLKIFDELWTKVNEKYFDPKFNGVDWVKMKEIYRPKAEKAESKEALLTILRQMLGELKTSHLAVWFAVSEKRLERTIGENFDGKREWLRLDAGFMTKQIEGRQIVTNVENGSSAKAAGVQMGWALIAVNNQPVSNEWIRFIESRKGQKIDYRFRDEKDEERNLSLTTDFIIVKYARVNRLLEGNVGYLKFDTFQTRGIGDWVRQEIAKFKQSKTVIVDLRGNGGGLISEAKSCLSPFFAQDVEFGTFVERSGKFKEQKIKGRGDDAFTGKVIVLVDEYTGSASEMFSAVMQENGRGQIVGTRTRGKVLNSLQFDLSDKVELLVAFRDYLSPKGLRLEGIGIKPDFEVELTFEDIRTGRDRVLEQAIKLSE